MEFSEKTHEVSMTALRLVSRMKRDWMAQGRRPSGLCGAALVVASRIHNFSRTIKDVIKIVKIGESTIRKRLAEFEQTPSSKLTIDEFQKIDLEEEMDPPCYTEGKKRAKLAQIETDMGQLSEEISCLQEEIDNEIQDSINKKFKRYKKYSSIPEDKEDSSELPRAPTPSDLDKELEQYSQFIDSKTLHELLGKTHSEIAKVEKTDEDSEVITIEVDGDNVADDSCGVKRDPVVEGLERSELHSITMPPPELATGLQGPPPTIASLGITSVIQDCVSATETDMKEIPGDDDSGELDLTDINDDELDYLILNDDEVKIKTTIWMRANADFLHEQKALAEKRAQEEEERKNKPETKRRRRTKKKQARTEATSAGEAIEKMLQEKKISSKINYDVLKDLNKPATDNEGGGPVQGEEPVEVSPAPIPSRFKRTSCDVVNTERSSSRKRARTVVKEEEEVKIEVNSTKPAEVIVESGPVQYAHQDEAPEEEEEEEEEGEDDEQHYSAAQLFGHTGDEDYGYEDFDE